MCCFRRIGLWENFTPSKKAMRKINTIENNWKQPISLLVESPYSYYRKYL